MRTLSLLIVGLLLSSGLSRAADPVQVASTEPPAQATRSIAPAKPSLMAAAAAALPPPQARPEGLEIQYAHPGTPPSTEEFHTLK